MIVTFKKIQLRNFFLYQQRLYCKLNKTQGINSNGEIKDFKEDDLVKTL